MFLPGTLSVVSGDYLQITSRRFFSRAAEGFEANLRGVVNFGCSRRKVFRPCPAGVGLPIVKFLLQAGLSLRIVMFSIAEIKELNTQFESESPETILVWAWQTFGPNIAATSSFQTQSVPLLDLISKVVPQLPVFFLDTGFHFPETLAFRDQLREALGLNVKNLRNEIGPNDFRKTYGELFRQNPDLCCFMNKVEPLQIAKKNLQAWVTGIRRDQTAERASSAILSVDSDGLYKVCPMANWTRQDIWGYIHSQQLPEHPLLTQGYMSVGCAPCTRPIMAGEDERAGRWAGQSKTECGLHLSIPVDQNNIIP